VGRKKDWMVTYPGIIDAGLRAEHILESYILDTRGGNTSWHRRFLGDARRWSDRLRLQVSIARFWVAKIHKGTLSE
jgi:hypothetical protein